MRKPTPLQIAKNELQQAQHIYQYWSLCGPKADKANGLRSLRRNIKAYEKLIADPDALMDWWNSIPQAGRDLMTTIYRDAKKSK